MTRSHKTAVTVFGSLALAAVVVAPTVGSAVVLPANVAAAVVTFGLGRRLGRNWLVRRLNRNRRLTAVDRAIRQAGLKIVFLLKLSPLCPFAIMNYALGATQLRLRDFVWASLVGAVPGTLLYVWLGSLLHTMSDVFSRRTPNAPQWPQALMIGTITLGAAVLVLIRTARQELQRAMIETPAVNANSDHSAPRTGACFGVQFWGEN